ncbi:DDE_3 domain-containing protein [Trichonephila clavipes]|nr:DDE_3 domain-containing protein [Trichonephila clavipes]
MAGPTSLSLKKTVRYREEVLEPYVNIFTGAVDSDFILIDENAMPHRANLVDKILENKAIHRMDWPVRSPHLILMEHAWNALQKAMGSIHVTS